MDKLSRARRGGGGGLPHSSLNPSQSEFKSPSSQPPAAPWSGAEGLAHTHAGSACHLVGMVGITAARSLASRGMRRIGVLRRKRGDRITLSAKQLKAETGPAAKDSQVTQGFQEGRGLNLVPFKLPSETSVLGDRRNVRTQCICLSL